MNNNLERARCIVNEFNKNYRPSPCCCINNGGTPINATFTIGTVTTGAPGSEAAASITGTSPNFILNLTIPQGITGPTGPIGLTGPQGIQGLQGIQGETGEIGPTGEAGPTGPQGEIGPQGPQGEIGPTGPAGEAATITIGTTTTGDPGTEASVVNSGTATNAILDFTIPQGPTGPEA